MGGGGEGRETVFTFHIENVWSIRFKLEFSHT
jgi:hypothetical protein